MLKGITYKNKLQLLSIFSLLFSVFVYQTVISKTIALYIQSKQLDQKITEASTAPIELSKLRKQLSELDMVVQNRQADTAQMVHDILLNFIGNYCKEKKLLLKSFPETFSNPNGQFEIQTHVFSVQGGFIDCLKMVYLLEQKVKVGKVSSLNFQLVKDIETKKQVLTTTVYLQNVKKIK